EVFRRFISMSRCCVAGDDDHLTIHLQQKLADPNCIIFNGVCGFISVWKMGSISEIDQRFMRQYFLNGIGDGESADARIEYADWIGGFIRLFFGRHSRKSNKLGIIEL